MKPTRRLVRSAAALAAVLLVCGCAVTGSRPRHQVTSLLRVAPDEMVVVGRIELYPPLQETEQEFPPDRRKELGNAFLLICGDRVRDPDADAAGSFDVPFRTRLNEEFFIKVPKDSPLFISGGIYFTADDLSSGVQKHFFSSPFQVPTRPGDDALYVGTIQYFRDGDNRLTAIRVRDDYEWADARYQKRFGTNKTLRKALVAPLAVGE